MIAPATNIFALDLNFGPPLIDVLLDTGYVSIYGEGRLVEAITIVEFFGNRIADGKLLGSMLFHLKV